MSEQSRQILNRISTSLDFEGIDFSSLTWILVPTSTVEIDVVSNSSRDIDVESVVIGRLLLRHTTFVTIGGQQKTPNPCGLGAGLPLLGSLGRGVGSYYPAAPQAVTRKAFVAYGAIGCAHCGQR